MAATKPDAERSWPYAPKPASRYLPGRAWFELRSWRIIRNRLEQWERCGRRTPRYSMVYSIMLGVAGSAGLTLLSYYTADHVKLVWVIVMWASFTGSLAVGLAFLVAGLSDKHRRRSEWQETLAYIDGCVSIKECRRSDTARRRAEHSEIRHCGDSSGTNRVRKIRGSTIPFRAQESQRSRFRRGHT
jgi:hypothetical protein